MIHAMPSLTPAQIVTILKTEGYLTVTCPKDDIVHKQKQLTRVWKSSCDSR
jgi:hypothetical protein